MSIGENPALFFIDEEPRAFPTTGRLIILEKTMLEVGFDQHRRFSRNLNSTRSTSFFSNSS